jgi:hypothetical protein
LTSNGTIYRTLSLPDGKWDLTLSSTLPLTGHQGLYVDGQIDLPNYKVAGGPGALVVAVLLEWNSGIYCFVPFVLDFLTMH